MSSSGKWESYLYLSPRAVVEPEKIQQELSLAESNWLVLGALFILMLTEASRREGPNREVSLSLPPALHLP